MNVALARETKETKIALAFDPEGTGNVAVETGIPFFDHMLTGMARHGGFDLTCTVTGDLGVDSHHTIEDTGIVLGDAIKQAIGEGRGIRRFAHAIIPMDESLAQVALDCGGRGYLVYSGTFGARSLGNNPLTFSSISSIRSASTRASRPTSGSPAGTITTSAKPCSRHSGLPWEKRSKRAGRQRISPAPRGSSEKPAFLPACRTSSKCRCNGYTSGRGEGYGYFPV